MLPHKLKKEVDEIYKNLLEPVRMNFLIYNDETIPYQDWLNQKRTQCGTRYSHLFVLKLKE